MKVVRGKLRELYLDGRYIKIKYLSKALYQYKDLRVLIIQGQNFDMPSELNEFNFFRFKKLKVLSIANIEIKELPSSLEGLKNLKELYIGDTKLLKLPYYFAKEGKDILNYERHMSPGRKAEAWKSSTEQLLSVIDESINPLAIGELWFNIRHYRTIKNINVIRNTFDLGRSPWKTQKRKNREKLGRYKQFERKYNRDVKLDIQVKFKLFIYKLMFRKFKSPLFSTRKKLSADKIRYLLEFMYSEDIFEELIGLKQSTFLIAKNSEITEAINYLIKRGSYPRVREYAQKIQTKVADIPEVDLQIIQKFDRSNDEETVEKPSQYGTIADMIEKRRCCRMHGRLSDSICNICGRVIPKEWVFINQ